MAETLTKAKLAELLHNRVGVTKKEAGALVDEVFGLMRDRLIDSEKVKISGFGNFVVRDKAARRGRNPQTSEEIIIDWVTQCNRIGLLSPLSGASDSPERRAVDRGRPSTG